MQWIFEQQGIESPTFF